MNLELKHLKLSAPLCVIDLETTGVNTQRDRIVEIAILRLDLERRRTWFHSLVNPECAIPPQASAIHGVFNSDVIDMPTFPEIAEDIVRICANADIVGFNLPFDLAILTQEFTRINNHFPLSGRALVDALAIYRLKEPRSLETAVRQYLGHEPTQTHNARADVQATLSVLDAQLGYYPELPKTPTELHAELVEVDLARKFRRGQNGEITFNFGKYTGQPLLTIAECDPGYLRWMLEAGHFLEDVKNIVRESLP